MDASGRDLSSKIRTYECSHHRKRGASICGNGLRIDHDILDEVLLNAINDVLDERVTEEAIEKALSSLRAGEKVRFDRRFAVGRELS